MYLVDGVVLCPLLYLLKGFRVYIILLQFVTMIANTLHVLHDDDDDDDDDDAFVH